ncbi:MAG: InlB B-repeat-containing protein [Firmicutes bacterium]|nr:InlB B-repeat-containing protein [Bacillota bacterium]MCL1953499.1 InlB B-repeat-containing protein [Bacillota bacterium]
MRLNNIKKACIALSIILVLSLSVALCSVLLTNKTFQSIDKSLGESSVFNQYPSQNNSGFVGDDISLRVSLKDGYDEGLVYWYNNDNGNEINFETVKTVGKGLVYQVPTDKEIKTYYFAIYVFMSIGDTAIFWDQGDIIQVEVAPKKVETIVTLDFNGGSGGTGQVDTILGEAMPQATAPTREGYIFGGYTDSVDGGKRYYDRDMNSVSVWDKEEDSSTLYAQWERDLSVEYVVTLDFNGGSGGTNQVTVKIDEAMPQATAPTREGYIFGGYTDSVDGGKRYYDDNMNSVSLWDKDTSSTLYAQWELEPIVKYIVTLDFNGGSGGTSRVEVIIGEAMPQATAPTREGYIFKGYTDSANGGKAYYDENMKSASLWDKEKNSTLYAQWELEPIVKFVVTLDFNGGIGGVNKVEATLGDKLPTVKAPTKEGYIFKGYTDKLEGGKAYYDEYMDCVNVWDKDKDSTLYAQWQKSELILPPPTTPANPSGFDNFGEIFGWSLLGVFVAALIASGIFIILKRRNNPSSSSSYSTQYDSYGSQNTFANNNYYSQYNNNPYSQYDNQNQSQSKKKNKKSNRDNSNYYDDGYGNY